MKKTKEEIRTKWIRHTPLLPLDECVDNAMQEYADQFLEGKKYTKKDIVKAIKFGQTMELLPEYISIPEFINSLNT